MNVSDPEDAVIVNEVGTRMGCGFVTFGCTLGQYRAARAHALSLHEDVFFVGVVDDVTQLDYISRLGQAHAGYNQVVRSWRGMLKEGKCAVVSLVHSKAELIAAGLPVAAVERGASGARLLGGPIGSKVFVRASWRSSSRG